jgi:hypothetical protein
LDIVEGFEGLIEEHKQASGHFQVLRVSVGPSGTLMVKEDDLKTEAEEKLDAAQAALSAYVESKGRDSSLLQLLLRNVDQAIADYQKLVG